MVKRQTVRLKPDEAQAEDEVIAALRASGWSVERMARGLRRSRNHIQRRVSALGLARPPLEPLEPIEGEEWRDRPDLGVRVSSLGRFASLKTGQLLRISKGRWHDYVTVRTGTPEQTTKACHLLVSETFGLGLEAKHRPYSETEDAQIRLSTFFDEAYSRLPKRTPMSVRIRARVIRHKLKKRGKAQRRASAGPKAVPFLTEVQAAVSRAIPRHIRDDLIADVVLLRLEGVPGDVPALVKRAMKERNYLTGAFKERSLDAPLRAGESFSLGELLRDDCDRY